MRKINEAPFSLKVFAISLMVVSLHFGSGCGPSQSGSFVDDNYGLGNGGVTTPPQPGNQAPRVVAMPDISITLPVDATPLIGAASDPDGTIASYAWSQVSGPSAAAFTEADRATALVSNLIQGSYVFKLTVFDNVGAMDTANVRVIVRPGSANAPPVANAGGDYNIFLPTSTIDLNGAASDPDGSVVAYQWSQVSGPTNALFTNPSQANSMASLLQAGRYVFRLTVTDNAGATDTDDMIVDVFPN